MLVVAAFFGGLMFERERRIREELAAQAPAAIPAAGTMTMRMVRQPDGTLVRVISPAGAANVIAGSNTTPGFDFNNGILGGRSNYRNGVSGQNGLQDSPAEEAAE